MNKIPFTKQGFTNLKKELELLLQKRPEAVKSLTKGREMGDLSENGLYKAAKQALNDIDREIRNLKYLIKSASVSIPTSTSIVQIGHKVVIKTEGIEKDFFMVGEFEADPKNNKISNKSPIGFALMGRKVGEEIKINTPNAVLSYKILSIE